MTKLGRKVGNRRSIRGEDLFFLEITFILGEKRLIRDQSHVFFREHQVLEILDSNLMGIQDLEAPNFEYPPLKVKTVF